MATVGQHQQSLFVAPVNGTQPIDASEVLSNDEALRAKYNAHDDDATIHPQSSVTASRPSAGVAGRLWFSSDDLSWAYDNGVSWDALAYAPAVHGHAASAITAGTFAAGTFTFQNALVVAGKLTAANPVNLGTVDLTFPTSHVAGVLANNGSGTLSWLANPITGSLTSTKLPKATGTGTLGDSDITEGASLVTIGTKPLTITAQPRMRCRDNTSPSTVNGGNSLDFSFSAQQDLVQPSSGAWFSGSNIIVPTTGTYVLHGYAEAAGSGVGSLGFVVNSVAVGRASRVVPNSLQQGYNVCIVADLTAGHVVILRMSASTTLSTVGNAEICIQKVA